MFPKAFEYRVRSTVQAKLLLVVILDIGICMWVKLFWCKFLIALPIFTCCNKTAFQPVWLSLGATHLI